MGIYLLIFFKTKNVDKYNAGFFFINFLLIGVFEFRINFIKVSMSSQRMQGEISSLSAYELHFLRTVSKNVKSFPSAVNMIRFIFVDKFIHLYVTIQSINLLNILKRTN